MNAAQHASRIMELIAAYGADPDRWPSAERDLASGMDGDPGLIQARDEAKMLDALLGAHGELSASSALVGRVTVQAEMARRHWRRLKTWWMLAALGGLGLAGAATGAAAMAVLTPPAHSYELYDLPTVFDGGQGLAGGQE